MDEFTIVVGIISILGVLCGLYVIRNTQLSKIIEDNKNEVEFYFKKIDVEEPLICDLSKFNELVCALRSNSKTFFMESEFLFSMQRYKKISEEKMKYIKEKEKTQEEEISFKFMETLIKDQWK